MGEQTNERTNGRTDARIRIIALAKDWADVPTCITHAMRVMGERFPVLWCDSIGTRKPSLARDRGRLWLRLRGGGRAVHRENRLSSLAPLLLPLPRARLARALNRALFAAQTASWRRRHPAMRTEYWCAAPTAAHLLPRRGVRVFYYCVDDWSRFAHLDGARLDAEERQLLARADAAFTPARFLADKLARAAAEIGRPGLPIRTIAHGVNWRQFHAALEPDLPLPAELAARPSPRIGFYGNLDVWIDYDRVAELARQRPSWTFVLVGPVRADLAPLRGLANILIPGRREHAELPAWCKGFDAAMIPYDRNDPRMTSVNPVKLKELLAAGVPVVAADIPELHGYGDAVRLCATSDEWLAALEIQIARRDRAAISAAMRAEDWSAKVDEMREFVEERGEERDEG